MKRFNRSLLAAAVVGGLSGGIGLVQTGFSSSSPTLRQLDEQHWKHPHMHNALAALHDARHQLEDAEDIFKGHREEALAHVDHAIEQVERGLKEQGDEAALPGALGARQLDGDRFPHLHRALERLREARTELDSSDKVFGGHRDEAIQHTDAAIHQLEEAIHE